MKQTFKPLFRLNFQHEYFNQGGAANVIQLGPKILNGAPNMGIRKTAEGCFVYAPEAAAELALSFPIYFLDPNFLNYTDIDFVPSKLLYFNKDQASDGALYSTKAIELPLCPSLFSYPIRPEEQSQLKTLQLNGPELKNWNLALPIPPYQDYYLLNINGELAGKYQLKLNFKDQSKDRLYAFFASDDFYDNPPQAVFEWKGQTNATNDNVPTYTLTFKARSTYWRYIFLGLKKKDWEQVEINSIKVNDQIISFQKAEEVYTLSDGRPAYTALSSAPIPLRERPTWKIRLQSKQLPDGLVLPYPQTSNLPYLAAKEGQSSPRSDIYCHIS